MLDASECLALMLIAIAARFGPIVTVVAPQPTSGVPLIPCETDGTKPWRAGLHP